jgi:TolB-like protein/Flp pilus assembly protein TadD
MPDQIDQSSAPPPAPASDAEVSAAKAKKKKAKARKEWMTFGSRVVAQVVGAAASVAIGLFVLQRAQQGDDAGAVGDAAAVTARVETPRPAGEVAIAVLPLSNFSADQQQEYFADGMTEALTAELAQIQGLHVISRTSVMQYKSTRKTIPQVAQELGVDFVVEGSVVRAGDRVRVTAQLIDAKTDKHVWARSYDRTIRDILSLQAAVATAIGTELKGALVPARTEAARKPVDPVVYDLYLRGRHAWALRSPEGFANAIKYFTEATKRDPEFALGYAGLADAFSLYPTASLVNRSVDNFARARAAAEKAIALDETLAEAHTSLAAVYFFGERNMEAAMREFQRALELNPHYPTAHQWYAIALSENGRHDEARKHAEEAVTEDPLNGVMHQALGLVRYYARDFEQAAAAQRKALELSPQLPLARVVLAKSLILHGKSQEAVTVCESGPEPRPIDVTLTMGIAHAKAGNLAAADAVFKELSGRQPRPTAVLAQWHAATGNYDTAFALLHATSGSMAPVLRIDPLYEGFRRDRRFSAAAIGPR